MAENVYKRVDLTGSSSTSIEDAVAKAVGKAAKTLHNLRWFEISEIRGDIDGDEIAHWQVSVKVGFTLDD